VIIQSPIGCKTKISLQKLWQLIGPTYIVKIQFIMQNMQKMSAVNTTSLVVTGAYTFGQLTLEKSK
jgi:hypothetical protein